MFADLFRTFLFWNSISESIGDELLTSSDKIAIVEYMLRPLLHNLARLSREDAVRKALKDKVDSWNREMLTKRDKDLFFYSGMPELKSSSSMDSSEFQTRISMRAVFHIGIHVLFAWTHPDHIHHVRDYPAIVELLEGTRQLLEKILERTVVEEEKKELDMDWNRVWYDEYLPEFNAK